MLKDSKSKIARRLVELQSEYDIVEVESIYKFARGLRVSVEDENYDIGCGLYHIGIRKINHKLFVIFLRFGDKVKEKAYCNTVADTLKHFEEYLVTLLIYHDAHKVFPVSVLNSVFEDLNEEQDEYLLINVLDAEKDLMFMLEKSVYESTQNLLSHLTIEKYKASKVNLDNLVSYINYLTGNFAYVSFEVKLERRRLSLSSPFTTLTVILPKDDLTAIAKLLTNRGYSVTYTD